MSGINRFLSRREKRTSGGPQKKVMPSSANPVITTAVASSPSSASSFKMPQLSSRLRTAFTFRSGSAMPVPLPQSCSASCVSLAFPQTPTRRESAPRSHMMDDMVHSTTADSLDLMLQPRLVLNDDPYGLFTADEGKKPAKDEEKKIKALQARLSRVGITRIKEPHIEYALRAKYADGDSEKAYEFLVLLEDSVDGIIRDYDLNIRPLGAVNREKVTCWLDALLFAMFARLGSFETILVTPFNDEPRKRLAMLLRLWVNMLRTGKLITVDITKLIQEALASCGWSEAAELHQQDVSEAFAFITEQLELPRLTLKMDIYHTGKEDAKDDHKLVNERLLQVAIPSEPPDGKVITLEDCLETYFNNRVEVRRHLEGKVPPASLKSSDSIKGHSVHIESAECASPLSAPSSPMRSPSNAGANAFLLANGRARSSSIIRERYVNDDPNGPKGGQGGSSEVRQRARRKSSLRKEVLMPAWQFFSLMPWYTDRAPTNDAQVAAHFSTEKPVLGLCLKRYSMLPNGRAIRLNTYIDIPLEIGLPHFIRDDTDDDDVPQFGNFKLSLQSVVCHRGVSVDAGHYVALVRCRAEDRAVSNGHRPSSQRQDGSDGHVEDEWIRFDDLARERVTPVDIQRALKEESPYLLFYQVQPVDDPESQRALHSPPPPYSPPRQDDTAGPAPCTAPSTASAGSMVDGDPSRRPSLERLGTGETPVRVSTSSDRRPSIVFDDAVDGGTGNAAASRSSKDQQPQPSGSRSGLRVSTDLHHVPPSATPPQKSQADEGRLSLTLSRLTARMSRDRLRGTDIVASTSDGDVVMGGSGGGGGGSGGGDVPPKKSKIRGKSRGRNDVDAALGPAHDRVPERQCLVM